MQGKSFSGAQPARGGIAATEFAICLPILLLLALACGDFGRVAFFHQVVANAARTAAETGAMRSVTSFTRPSWEADVYQAALLEMQNVPDFDEDQFEYEISTSTDDDDFNRVTIVVAYPFRTVVAWPGLPGEVLLRRTVEFRQFR